MKHILILNCGSSSVKFKIIAMPAATTLLVGSIKGIGEKIGEHRLTLHVGDKPETRMEAATFPDHDAAFAAVHDDLNRLTQSGSGIQIEVIGHRVVHGGCRFFEPVQLTPEIVEQIAELELLAPQHLPGNLQGIRLCMALFDDLPQVAVFDSAFHHNMPEYAYRYPIPEKWYRDFGIRRYGFHGSSHQYVAGKASAILGKPLEQLNLISLHLGNGDSACAIRNGQSIDSSMGFTPLEGLMMGSRCGDLDASIPLYLQQKHGLSVEEVAYQLNFESGLQAICQSHDMRDIIRRAQAGEAGATLARDMFVYHVRKYIGAYLIALGDLDALIFTGGIGEHSAEIRARCCEGLARFGLCLDNHANLATDDEVAVISEQQSTSQILVIPTDEELQIAREVSAYLQWQI